MPDNTDAEQLARIARACEEAAAGMNMMIRYLDDMIAVLVQIRDSQ